MTDPSNDDEHGSGTTPTLQRLDRQSRRYESASRKVQRYYLLTKILQLVIGASVPVLVLIPNADPVVPAVLAATVVILEGLQQLFQWQTTMVLYRGTAASLRKEKYLFLAHTTPYHDTNRDRVLAERVESLLSEATTQWAEVQATKDDAGAGTTA